MLLSTCACTVAAFVKETFEFRSASGRGRPILIMIVESGWIPVMSSMNMYSIIPVIIMTSYRYIGLVRTGHGPRSGFFQGSFPRLNQAAQRFTNYIVIAIDESCSQGASSRVERKRGGGKVGTRYFLLKVLLCCENVSSLLLCHENERSALICVAQLPSDKTSSFPKLLRSFLS